MKEISASKPAGQSVMAILTEANAEMMESLGGVSLVELDKEQGAVTLAFECLPRFCHSSGRIAQGGFVTAWMDAAMAHAVILCSDRQLNIASLDINVRFMQPVGPGRVVAHGKIVRQGKRIAFLSAELFDSSGTLAATATSSGMLVPMTKPD